MVKCWEQLQKFTIFVVNFTKDKSLVEGAFSQKVDIKQIKNFYEYYDKIVQHTIHNHLFF